MQTIVARGASATVDSDDGGRLVSLIVGGFEVIGGAPSVAGAPAGWFHGSFPMAPYAGRIRNAEVTFEGETFRLEANAGRHAAHGIVYDRPWSVESSTATRIVMTADFDARWPWGGTARQELRIGPGHLDMDLTLRNESRRMPCSAGYHPWFVRRGAQGDAVMSFHPAARYEMDADGFTHAPVPDLGVRPWDDVFRDLASPPIVGWPGGPVLELTSSHEVWTVYERLDAGLCIEPWTAPPNSLGTNYATLVEPGIPLVLRFRIAWD